LRISTAVTCSLRSDATSGVVSSSSHATARYCRIHYRNLTVTGEGTFLPLLQEYHLQQRQHQNRYPTPCDANDVVVWTMKRVQMLSFRTKNEIGAVKHTKLFRVRVYTLINTVNRAVTTILGGPAQSSRIFNSESSGNTPHKVGEERSKESKSESGDFGHDLFSAP
jgi:hypothetical protein